VVIAQTGYSCLEELQLLEVKLHILRVLEDVPASGTARRMILGYDGILWRMHVAKPHSQAATAKHAVPCLHVATHFDRGKLHEVNKCIRSTVSKP
jgi:hypothetical protein